MEDAGKGKRRRATDEDEPTLTPAASAGRLTASGAEESAGQEEDQMEKFYALLGSIRAMRETCRIISAQKRAKQKNEAPPPLWKPTFELEDFEDAAKTCDASSTKNKGNGKEGGDKRRGGGGGEEEGSSSSSGSGSLNLSLGLGCL